MLHVINDLYENALKCVKIGIPLSIIRKEQVFEDVVKMKYDIPNDHLERLDTLRQRITEVYDGLREKYQ